MLRLILLALLPLAAHAADVAVPIKITGAESACLGFTVTGNVLTCIPVGGPPAPPTPPPSAITCPGFKTTHNIGFVWQDNGANDIMLFVSKFTREDALVVAFKGPNVDPTLQLGVTHSGGQTGSSATRTFVLSTKPCDFAIPTSPDALWGGEANVMSLRLSSGVTVAGRVRLEPGVDYYLNVKNTAYGGTAGCGAPYCDVFLTISNTSGSR